MLLNSSIQLKTIGKSLLFDKLKSTTITCVSTMKKLAEPPKIEILGFPEVSKLKQLPKQPTYPSGMKAPKMTRAIQKMRGPELVHNKLIHKQYGIIALSGGQLKNGHYNMIQTTLHKKLDYNKAFAIWRVDAPNRPVTKHGQGKKLGGGKGNIDHYMLPVKRGRVIIEVGGKIEFERIFRILQEISEKLPFPARPVTQEMLEEWDKNEEELRVNNINKLKWEWCIKNNILNCLNYCGKYDIEFAHLGPDCR